MCVIFTEWCVFFNFYTNQMCFYTLSVVLHMVFICFAQSIMIHSILSRNPFVVIFMLFGVNFFSQNLVCVKKTTNIRYDSIWPPFPWGGCQVCRHRSCFRPAMSSHLYPTPPKRKKMKIIFFLLPWRTIILSISMSEYWNVI